MNPRRGTFIGCRRGLENRAVARVLSKYSENAARDPRLCLKARGGHEGLRREDGGRRTRTYAARSAMALEEVESLS